MPLFPELRPHLEAVFDEAPEGTVYVVPRCRDATQNLRTTFAKIIHRAGLSPWPKLFQNLRASRATQLASEHPAHVAAAWLGHSTIVANKHYWQVTDADYDRPAKSGAESGTASARNVFATARNSHYPPNRPIVLNPWLARPCAKKQPGAIAPG